MSNEMTTVENTALAEVMSGNAELIKAPSCKGAIIAGAIGTVTTAGAGIGCYLFGKKKGKAEGRKEAEDEFEDRLSAVEEFLAAKEYQIVNNDDDEEEEKTEV